MVTTPTHNKNLLGGGGGDGSGSFAHSMLSFTAFPPSSFEVSSVNPRFCFGLLILLSRINQLTGKKLPKID